MKNKWAIPVIRTKKKCFLYEVVLQNEVTLFNVQYHHHGRTRRSSCSTQSSSSGWLRYRYWVQVNKYSMVPVPPPWEDKAVFMLYTELFIGLVKVSSTQSQYNCIASDLDPDSQWGCWSGFNEVKKAELKRVPLVKTELEQKEWLLIYKTGTLRRKRIWNTEYKFTLPSLIMTTKTYWCGGRGGCC